MNGPIAPENNEPPPKQVIAKRLAVGFGSVSAVAVAMGLLLIGLIAGLSGLVTDMQKNEVAIRESLALAMAVREQYMHQAHWLIERQDNHLDHSHESLERVERGAKVLRNLIPASEHHRLDTLWAASQDLDRMFKDTIRPAALRGDTVAVSREHHHAQQLSQIASDEADAVVRTVEHKMASSHLLATRATELGLLGGGLCILFVLGLSAGHTIRLRRLVLRPLRVLSDAASRIGAGEFETRLGEVGDGELHAVAQAFDRMAEEIEAREKRIVASERMAAIGQLAAGVAHEINNPIGIIRGYLKTMGPDSSPEALEEELAILDEEAAACQRIAEDLVEFSRVPHLRYDATPMNILLKETVRRFQESPRSEDIIVTLKAEPGTVSSDAGRIRQVLLNLLLNAAHAAPSNSTIEVRGKPNDAGYEVEVADRGSGVVAEDRARIFEPFYSKRRGGSGLGLAVCQGIIQAHGGTILVEDRPGGGALFRFCIPHSPNEAAS